MRNKIRSLFEEVKKLEETSGKIAHKSKTDANELSAGLVSSYSLAGDVEHAKNTANLSMQKHESIKKLSRELEGVMNGDLPVSVNVPCYISLSMSSGTTKDVYLVENPVFINGFNLVSPSSPIGKALIGQRKEDLFLYKIGEQTFTGKILEIG